MPVTLKDVAIAAGVSIRTVSRVVNNQGEIGEDTRERIWEIIRQLGYRPNQLARSMISGKTRTIGIIIPDITDPFFPEFILGTESVARERGYNIFLSNANRQPDLELKYMDLLIQRQVDGFIIAGSRLDPNQLAAGTENHHAIILTPYSIPGKTIFTINDFNGGQQIGAHLLNMGHRCVGYIEGTWAREDNGRHAGLVSSFNGTVTAQKVAVASIYPAKFESACQAARQLLSQEPQITALVGYNDIVALGILQACRELGKKVPEEISVVGFDDIPEVSRSTPALTTIHIDRLKLGSEMMTALINEIEGKENQQQQVLVDGYLINRESTAPARIVIPNR